MACSQISSYDIYDNNCVSYKMNTMPGCALCSAGYVLDKNSNCVNKETVYQDSACFYRSTFD